VEDLPSKREGRFPSYLPFLLIVMVCLAGLTFGTSAAARDVPPPAVNLPQMIEERGFPGIIPSPGIVKFYSSMAAQPPKVADWPAPLPQEAVTGTRNILVIRIDFPDKAGTQPQSYYQNLVFGTSSGQLKHYYLQVSYDLLSITGTVTSAWVRSAHNMVWWGADSSPGHDNTNGYIFGLAREAVVQADTLVNFATYDVNGNGIIDPDELSLCIVHAGNGQESSGVSTDIWSHHWYIFGQGYTGFADTFVDGKRISKHPDDNVGGYFMQAESSPMGTYAHEFGHDIGLPDLYDTDYSSAGVGNWDLMGSGSWLGSPQGSSPSHPSGWCKAKLGWISPTIVTYGTGITAMQIETYRSESLYQLAITSTEYFLIENRQKTGYDGYLPGSGMLIWHIDNSKDSNANENDRWVDLEEAHGGIQDLHYYGRGDGDAYDPFYSPAKTRFTDTTDPSSKTKAGSRSGIAVSNIGASASVMTFDVRPFVSTDKTTYAQLESIVFTGTGFTPSGEIRSCISTNNVAGVGICWGPLYADNQGNVWEAMLVGTDIPAGPQKFWVADVSTSRDSNAVQLTITSSVTTTVTRTVTSTVGSTSYTTRYTTRTVTSYTSTSTLTSTIPTVTTVVLVPLTMTSTAQSTQYLTSILTTTVTSYTGTETSTSTIVVPTTVTLAPSTSTSTVQTTQVLTSTGTTTVTGYTTTTVTSYTGTTTSTSTIPTVTTVVLVPLTMTSTVQSIQYLTSILTTTVTSYTATSTSTSTSVVYTTVTASPGGAGAGTSSPLVYLGFLSLLAVAVGRRVTAGKGLRIPKVRSVMESARLTYRVVGFGSDSRKEIKAVTNP